jgi:predicted DNA repair protein MutK
MKLLSVAGTAAMFLVGGGILVHGIPPLHHWVDGLPHGGLVGSLLPTLVNAGIGVVAGAVVLGGVLAVTRVVHAVRGKKK